MAEANLKINCKTEGFDEAEERIEAVTELIGGFPPQVTIRNCNNCTFHIHPSQLIMKEREDE